ncbi:MAG TPA: DegV family protein [Coriobacteriia bacterium]
MPVSVVTDSVASIPPDMIAENDIDVVSLYVNDGETNQRELDMDVAAFYSRIEDPRSLPTSSQPSVEEILSAFRRALERGSDVVGVFISEKMSGTLQTARLAAGMALGEFPDARIELVDSGSNSMETGFAAIAAAQAARAGGTIERCVAAAGQTLRRTRYLFTPHTLEYLRRGGRIGGASALVGGLLQIKPILTVEHGEVETFAKVRTQSRALAEIARKLADDIAAWGLKQVIVHYIVDRELAEQYAREQIEPLAGGPVRVIPVSPVIGLHVGPAIGIVYETERDWA